MLTIGAEGTFLGTFLYDSQGGEFQTFNLPVSTTQKHIRALSVMLFLMGSICNQIRKNWWQNLLGCTDSWSGRGYYRTMLYSIYFSTWLVLFITTSLSFVNSIQTTASSDMWSLGLSGTLEIKTSPACIILGSMANSLPNKWFEWLCYLGSKWVTNSWALGAHSCPGTGRGLRRPAGGVGTILFWVMVQDPIYSPTYFFRLDHRNFLCYELISS